MNSLVTLPRPEVKDEDLVDDIVLEETTVASNTLKGADQTLLYEIKPFCCVLN